MTLATNETLDLNATTFRTEAEKIVQAHPDAIMTEALARPTRPCSRRSSSSTAAR